MILIKLLIAFKSIIYGVVIIIIKPVFLVFKFLLTKPLIRLYHLIFKLRKSGLTESPWHELIRRHTIHILVLSLTSITIFSNIINYRQDAGNPAKLANKTIVSHLIKNEFNTITDENDLIEEKVNMRQLLAASKERYRDLRTVISSSLQLEDDNDIYLADARNLLRSGSPFGQLTSDNDSSDSISNASRSEIIYYTVQQGDTISSIAKKFSISVNTVLWSNELSAFSLIRIGNKLSILPISGVSYIVKSGDSVGKIARAFNVEEEKIFEYNNIKSANALIIGQSIILPGGSQIKKAPTIAKSNTTSKVNNAVAVIEKLVNPKKAPSSSGSMAWPTAGHRITQYYSWRHTGLDIANKIGTPLYAAESGTVEFSGWSNGYGNNVVINHGGGKKTRYAHASKLFVKVGESVERGEQVANMGSTGWSTGSHIHFEVIINGTKYNPLSYIK